MRRPQRGTMVFFTRPPETSLSRLGNRCVPYGQSLRFRYLVGSFRPRPCRLHPETVFVTSSGRSQRTAQIRFGTRRAVSTHANAPASHICHATHESPRRVVESAVCCVAMAGAGPSGSDGSRTCRVSGRTTNRRPRRSDPDAAARAPGARGRALPARRASSRSGSSATGRAAGRGARARRPQQAREADGARRSSRRADRVRHSSSTTASCRSRSSTRTSREHARRHRAPRAPKPASRVGSVNVRGSQGCARTAQRRARRRRARAQRVTPKARSRRRRDRSSSPRPRSTRCASVEPAADAIHLASADISRDRQEPRRGGHRRLRRPAARAAVSGSAVVRRDRDDAVARALLDATNRRISRVEPGARALIRRAGADPRESSRPMQPVAVMVSYRLGGADGVAVEARKWEWALHELGFDVRRVAGEFDDGLRPDDAWLPFLAIDPVDGEHARTRRARRRRSPGADLVVVENLCSLPINPDASTLTADVLAEHDGPRGVPPPRPSLAARRARRRPPASRRTGRTRCTSRSTTTRASSSRTAASRRSRSATRSTSIRRAATATRTRAAFGFAADDLVLLQPTRAIPRKNVPAAIEFADRARGARDPTERAALDHRARRGRLRRSCSRASLADVDDPGHRRARRDRRPTPTPPPTSSSSRRPGRASATR